VCEIVACILFPPLRPSRQCPVFNILGLCLSSNVWMLHTHTHTHAYTHHTCIYTHTYIHIHTHTQNNRQNYRSVCFYDSSWHVLTWKVIIRQLMLLVRDLILTKLFVLINFTKIH
jgi:hypothetical protein